MSCVVRLAKSGDTGSGSCVLLRHICRKAGVIVVKIMVWHFIDCQCAGAVGRTNCHVAVVILVLLYVGNIRKIRAHILPAIAATIAKLRIGNIDVVVGCCDGNGVALAVYCAVVTVSETM